MLKLVASKEISLRTILVLILLLLVTADAGAAREEMCGRGPVVLVWALSLNK